MRNRIPIPEKGDFLPYKYIIMEYILYLHRVFHGIKFKVNKDWLS